MSLATRCTACGTVFRVVQDQLKVSEGWVRCGRCSEVFNALEGLFDLERDTPPPWSPPAPVEPAVDDAAHASEDERSSSVFSVLRDHPHAATPAERVSKRDQHEFADARLDPEMLAPDDAVPDGIALTELLSSFELEPDTVAPGFVRRAQLQARWHSPRRRMALALGALLLVATLGLQAVHHFRNRVAARWPETRSALSLWCDVLNCTIEAPRRIEDMSVESSALTRAATPDAFALAVTLRNRGATAVALPAVDLSLTDQSGQLLARRVLTPGDFRVTASSLSPGAEAAMQLVLSVGSAHVTGYTVEIFYP